MSLPPKGRGSSSITPDRFDRAACQRLFARSPLAVIFGLLTNVRIGVLERTQEVFGRQVTTDVTVDAGRVHAISAGYVFADTIITVSQRFLPELGER